MTHTRTLTPAALLCALLAVPVVGQTQDRAEAALRLAMETETVKGDLRTAIEQYRQIASGRDRRLAAKALLRMADCYERLGDAQSRVVYERLVRDFSDQKEEVVLARARLAGRDAAARARERPVSLDPAAVFPGTVSADGRLVSFTTRAGDVVVRDLVTGADRVLVRGTSSERAAYTVVSRDGTRVAFNWGTGSSRRSRILVVNAQGPGNPEARPLLAPNDDRITALLPLDWSPDGKRLAVVVIRKDAGPQIALVSIEGGAMQIVTTFMEGTRFPRNIFFSPDSRYIAYSADVPATRNSTRVVVMATAGASRENVVVDHPSANLVMGWSPDGASLVFGSDRNGSFGLWTVPVLEGRSQGAPVLVKADALGSDPVSLGVTASGALHVWKSTSNFYVQAAPIDVNAGRLAADPGRSLREFVGGGGKPAWSGDGRQLAYLACAANCNRTSVIKVRAVDTGQARELPMRLAFLNAQTDLIWSPDGATLTALGGVNGRSGLFQIDAQNGDTQAVGGTPFTAFQGTNVTSDGTKVYAAVGGGVAERDLASGTDRVVFAERAPGNTVAVRSSPDRRYTAFMETAKTKGQTLFVMPYGGGEPKELFHATGSGDRFGRHGMAWTPDSRAILTIVADGQSQELWLVPVTEGSPRKLDIDVSNWLVNDFTGGFALRPDGQQIAFVAGEFKEEVVALEHVVPAASAGRR